MKASKADIHGLTDEELLSKRTILAERVEVIQFDLTNLNQLGKFGRRMTAVEWNTWRNDKKHELAETLRELREVKAEYIRRHADRCKPVGDAKNGIGTRRAVNILADLIVALEGVPVPELARRIMKEARDRKMVDGHSGIATEEF